MLLKIQTRSQILLNCKCSDILLPSIKGEVQILKDHIPMIILLQEGVVIYDKCRIPINRSIAHIENNIINILCQENEDLLFHAGSGFEPLTSGL